MAVIPITGQVWVIHCCLFRRQALDITSSRARGGTRGRAHACCGRSGDGRACGTRRRFLAYVLRVVCKRAAIDDCKTAREIQQNLFGRAQRRAYHNCLWATIFVETAPLPIVIVLAFAAMIVIPITGQVWVVHCSFLWRQAIDAPDGGGRRRGGRRGIQPKNPHLEEVERSVVCAREVDIYVPPRSHTRVCEDRHAGCGGPTVVKAQAVALRIIGHVANPDLVVPEPPTSCHAVMDLHMRDRLTETQVQLQPVRSSETGMANATTAARATVASRMLRLVAATVNTLRSRQWFRSIS